MIQRLLCMMTLRATRQLMRAAFDCPSRVDRVSFDRYQAEVLQPLRDRLGYFADLRNANGGALY